MEKIGREVGDRGQAIVAFLISDWSTLPFGDSPFAGAVCDDRIFQRNGLKIVHEEENGSLARMVILNQNHWWESLQIEVKGHWLFSQ